MLPPVIGTVCDIIWLLFGGRRVWMPKFLDFASQTALPIDNPAGTMAVELAVPTEFDTSKVQPIKGLLRKGEES